jgi:hypothetical protein
MKMMLAVLAAVVMLSMGAAAWVLVLPATRTGTAIIEIAASPSTIMAVLEDVEAQPNWREGIASVARHNNGWTETTARGEKIDFVWTEQSPLKLSMQFVSDAGYTGEWTAVLEPTASGTELVVTESATTNKLLTRLLAHLFFDPQAYARAYIIALKDRAEELE